MPRNPGKYRQVVTSKVSMLPMSGHLYHPCDMISTVPGRMSDNIVRLSRHYLLPYAVTDRTIRSGCTPKLAYLDQLLVAPDKKRQRNLAGEILAEIKLSYHAA